jgi:hypothetical protein
MSRADAPSIGLIDPAHLYPKRLSHFSIRSVILLKRQPFFGVNSAILLDIIEIFAQAFCYSELKHFFYNA